ncbi:MAG: SBBP repeat-containing protein [Pseudomonadota bacterium]
MNRLLCAAAAASVLLCFTPFAVAAPEPAATPAQVLATLAFEENRGQADEPVRFLARGPGYRVYLTPREAAMVFESDGQPREMRMSFEGANPAPSMRGEQLLDHRTNYLGSADPTNNIVGVRSHSRVRYRSLYPGVDLVYYASQGKLEYDLVVAPRADAGRIAVAFSGAKPRLAPDGELQLDADGLQLRYHRPVAYQDIGGQRKIVDARYVIARDGAVKFALAPYDRSRALVIDPILSYASYSWGATANAVATDSAGNAYITGGASGSGPAATSTYQTRVLGTQDVYVAKVDPTGKQLLWATYIGSRKGSATGVGIALDASGNVYVAGTTATGTYPVTAGAYQTTYTAGSFVTKLNATGTALVYSTFVNGGNVTGMALGTGGDVYLTGNANALVTTAGAFQPTGSGTTVPFVARLNATGNAMTYATYLGGSGGDTGAAIAVGSDGSAYVTGTAKSTNFPLVNAMRTSRQGPSDAFVARLNPAGSQLVYSTYLGGASYDDGLGIAVDAQGQAHVVGRAYSDDFPTTAGSFQPRNGFTSPNFSNGFIAKFSASGTSLVYASYLGGRWCSSNCGGGFLGDGDALSAVALDASGHAYVGGWSISGQFPQVEPFQDVPAYYSEYTRQLFVAKIRPAGDGVVYADVLGGRDFDLQVRSIAADRSGGAFFVGTTVDLPFTAGAQSPTAGGGAVVKIAPGRYPTRLNSSLNPVVVGQPITLTADVQNPAPGGTVSFYDGATAIGSAPVAAGRATLSVSLAAGVHKLSAVFSGDALISPPVYQLVKGQ